MKRSSSLRLIDWPSQDSCFSATAMRNLRSGRARRGLLGLELVRRPPHRLDDVLVAGAAADIPGQRPADLLLAGVGVFAQQRRARQHHPRGAEAALQAMLLLEAFLNRVKAA